MKRITTFLLALMATITFASAEVYNGTCGDNLTWSLNTDDGTFTITGEGPMYEYNWDSPWYDYRDTIKSVIVGEGVTTIGATAFRDCRHMQQCSLPSTLQSIGNEAFCFCFQLISVDIPQSCTSISGWGAFNLVPNLNIQDENVAKESGARSLNGYVDGLFVYDNSEKRSLRACSSAATGVITLDDAVERIEYMAFAQCEDITHIHFGSNLKYIGEWSLDGCRGLDSLQFHEGLTEIAPHGFGNCFGLRYVSLPNSLTTLGDFAIGNCPDLHVIHLGESLTSVGNQIFDYCQSIDTIYASMPTPPVLDETAFAATDLSKVICLVPDQSVSLYKNALVWKEMNIKSIDSSEPCLIASGTCGSNLIWELSCDSVLTISGIGAMTSAPWINNYKLAINNAIIEDGVTNVYRSAFWYCSNLKSVTIGNSVTQIDDYAFYECNGLLNITIGNNVISLGQEAFSGCRGLTAISLPNSLTTIKDWAFSNCRVLTSVTIPQNVASIGQAAFGGCFSLTEINVISENTNFCSADGVVFNKAMTTLVQYPGGVQGDYIIPNSVTAVAAGAFWNCPNITGIKIPSGVTSLGERGFSACKGLTTITCEAVTPPTCGTEEFYSVDKSIPVYVPAESVNAYKSASYWSEFTNIQKISVEYTVTFLDWDGTELVQIVVERGDAATPPTAPTREGYTFTGWDKDFSNVTEDMTITALYELGVNTDFTINFNTKDGDEILSNSIVLKVPAAPQIAGFTFVGWRPVTGIIEGNTIDLEAVYTPDEPTSAPAVVSSPANPAQKLIRQGNVYILKDEKTYTIQGHEVK